VLFRVVPQIVRYGHIITKSLNAWGARQIRANLETANMHFRQRERKAARRFYRLHFCV
jgi:hypothetical protein